MPQPIPPPTADEIMQALRPCYLLVAASALWAAGMSFESAVNRAFDMEQAIFDRVSQE